MYTCSNAFLNVLESTRRSECQKTYGYQLIITVSPIGQRSGPSRFAPKYATENQNFCRQILNYCRSFTVGYSKHSSLVSRRDVNKSHLLPEIRLLKRFSESCRASLETRLRFAVSHHLSNRTCCI